ncbi:SoxR reducing system RseC family protein [Niabella sp. 22666]|uniref:SoxR reducing system RseC family protein n=1 Tax=Niabella sp. 22666 TaxID=3453954 RepID=UPI003F85A926
MAEENYVEGIKKTKKMKRQFEDYLNYFIFIFPLGITFIGFLMIIDFFRHNSEIGQLLISFIPISLGLLFAYFTLKRLIENIKFETIENPKNLDLDKLKVAIENYFRTNRIDINKELGLIEVSTKLTGFSWGERITIIKDGSTFLVNSKPSQPITIYKDRKNIKKIREILTE